MSVILCGPPMCGKSYYGKCVAERLNRPFIDTDELLEVGYFERRGIKLDCRDIFLKEGEASFRQFENEAIRRLPVIGPAIIAIGGGTLMDSGNVEVLKKLGLLILLKTELPILLLRLKQRKLPAYLKGKNPEQAFAEIVHKRNDLYLQYADVVIDTAGYSENQIIHYISQQLREESHGK
jgi:shikimate kinase